METIDSWTFMVTTPDNFSGIMSAGRWDTIEQASKAASKWLANAVNSTHKAYGVRVCMVTEYDIENA